MRSSQPSPGWNPPIDMDGETVTPQRLIAWLDAKFSRHGEEEDKWAADYIRATLAAPGATPPTKTNAESAEPILRGVIAHWNAHGAKQGFGDLMREAQNQLAAGSLSAINEQGKKNG